MLRYVAVPVTLQGAAEQGGDGVPGRDCRPQGEDAGAHPPVRPDEGGDHCQGYFLYKQKSRHVYGMYFFLIKESYPFLIYCILSPPNFA